jgi:replicative DNA helicase
LLTFFSDLDAMTLGLPRSGLFLLSGSTSVGKTSFALNLVRNIAEYGSKSVDYYTYDSASTELLIRIWSSLTDIESGRISTSRLTADEWQLLGQAISRLELSPLFLSDQRFTSISALADCIRRRVSSECKPSLIVLDDLSRICACTGASPPEMLSWLRDIVDELALRILLIAQSRPLDVKAGQDFPSLLDLPFVDVAQSLCDIIWMIHRDEYWNPDSLERGVARLIFMKHKNGPVGTIMFNFYPQYSKYLLFGDARA